MTKNSRVPSDDAVPGAMYRVLCRFKGEESIPGHRLLRFYKYESSSWWFVDPQDASKAVQPTFVLEVLHAE